MKKKFTLIAILCSLTFITVAQTLVCPQFFKRNNGNAGTCDALITFQFASCPVTPIQVDALLTGGINGTPIPGLTFSTASCSNGKVDVCINGSNIPTAGTLTVVFSNGTVASKITCDVPSGGPLPVNLSSFLVGRTGADVSLNWKTEIEMNVVNFEVQRSYDNGSFKTIATVPGNVNGVSIKSYSFVDNTNTSQSMSFYRLKIVKQGEISYSDIKTVKGLAGKAGFVIFPNPSVGNAKITISDLSEPTRIQLLDNSGRLVKSLMLNNTNTVELNGLQKGAYMVRIIGSVSGNTEIRKLTVIN